MQGLGELLIYAGAIDALFGLLGTLRAAFRTSRTWGRVCLIVPLAWIVFAATHWSDAAKPVLTYAISWFVMLLGEMLLLG